MKDIELAKKILEEGDYALLLVKDKKIIFKSRDKGIKPMYILSTEMKDIAYGAAIADKVIGRGGALLCKYLGVKEVHGGLISKAAMDLLSQANIPYSFDELCEYIKNQDGTDYCPIEKISMKISDEETFLEELHRFFRKNDD